MAASLGRMPQERTTANRADASTDTTGVALPNEPAPRNRLLDSLEPGPLRDELMRGEAPASTRAALVEPNVPAVAHRLRFTGDGREYFRIWIVNLLLTLGTFGVYGAWAKVRKLRYFRQNTLLDGHAFDFHARPLPMLLGRIVALLLLVAYLVAIDVSLVGTLAVMVLLAALGPWLLLQAHRFRLRNTSWRGLRFGFEARTSDAYRAVLPPLGVWFAGVLLTQALGRTPRTGTWTSLVGLAFPWIHHRLKAFQHGHATYGDRRFDFAPALGAFYAIYLLAGFLGLATAAVALLVASQIVATIAGKPVDKTGELFRALPVIAVVVAASAVVTHGYIVARLQKLAWAQTSLAGVSFATEIAAWPLIRLYAKNAFLTLVTAGFYWPFAAVAVARYRIEAFSVGAQGSLSALAASTSSSGNRGATGDAAVEVFGVEVGL